MRTIAWCVLALSLTGCHSGPRWFTRNHDAGGRAYYDDSPATESAPTTPVPQSDQPSKEGPTLTVPPQPAQKERTPYETSSRSRGWFGGQHASHSKSSSRGRTTQTARKSQGTAPAAKATSQDESVMQLMADLEKIKREKAALETKLSEESAKQTQQRLELEARLALIQEQMRQQSALQQVTYQQQASAMSRPMSGYAGPTITSGTPNPTMQMPFSSSTPTYAPQSQPPQQAIPAWGNSAPVWNTPATPQQQQIEQWPYSPQRR